MTVWRLDPTALWLYERPRRVHRIEECAFFHTMELPGYGLVRGLWDLRATIEAYLGRPHLDGKRVLDVGTASGYLTFEMERRGAQVVSFDAVRWEEVPYAWSRAERARRDHDMDAALDRLKNGYWLAHRALRSRARVVYGDVYRLPPVLGAFDVVVMGMILGHLRDPVQSLVSAARLTRDLLIVTEGVFEDDRPIGYFSPDAARRTPTNIWWSMSAACIVRMLNVLGFEVETRQAYHRCLHGLDGAGNLDLHAEHRDVPVNTFVARRGR
jgi:SAM-dependent methyltransferase